jgi:MtfA peptidase
MGDTIYYNKDGIAVPFDSLPPKGKELIQQFEEKPSGFQQTKIDDRPNYAPWVLLFFGVVAYFGVKNAWKSKGTTILGGSGDRRNGYDTNYDGGNRQKLLKDYLVYEGRDLVIPVEQYERVLSKYSPYYCKLAPELKEKFLLRTKEFCRSKTFLVRSKDPFIEMPVMLSAAAVQLTFGMDDYLLPHYQYIRIFPKEYIAKDSLHVLVGHVVGNTITIAWDQFLEDYQDYTDGANVGLHELAHALYYQHVHADAIKSRTFISNFNEVMEEGHEVYQHKHSSPSELFSDYAYKNLQEFWAESIELFFERPSDLKRENTELYDSLKDILNQDPVNELYPIVQ